MRQPDISLCACVFVCVQFGRHQMRGRGGGHAPHTLSYTHPISYKRAWMVIQLQPALSKQVKEKKRRRRRMRDEVSGQKQHGELACPPHPDECPRQIPCEWEHILRSYASHLSLRRTTETCRKRWLVNDVTHVSPVVWWGTGASACPCRPLSLSASFLLNNPCWDYGCLCGQRDETSRKPLKKCTKHFWWVIKGWWLTKYFNTRWGSCWSSNQPLISSSWVERPLCFFSVQGLSAGIMKVWIPEWPSKQPTCNHIWSMQHSGICLVACHFLFSTEFGHERTFNLFWLSKAVSAMKRRF